MTLEAKLIAIMAFILVISLGGLYLHHEAYQEAEAAYNAKIVKANLAAKSQLDAVNATIAKNQSDLNAAQQAIIDKQKELENGQRDYDDLHAKYIAGTKRMSVPAYSGVSSTPQDHNAGVAAIPGENRPIDILPETAAAILDTGRGYSEDVRLKNECIDLYNAARDEVNK